MLMIKCCFVICERWFDWSLIRSTYTGVDLSDNRMQDLAEIDQGCVLYMARFCRSLMRLYILSAHLPKIEAISIKIDAQWVAAQFEVVVKYWLFDVWIHPLSRISGSDWSKQIVYLQGLHIICRDGFHIMYHDVTKIITRIVWNVINFISFQTAEWLSC